MAFISATFTLPGLAGLVLTIGMAVDSNVLIFERMREELGRGASLRMAIQNGFDKALAAIIDSNVTTLITAIILYLIGTDLIRGFAVSLFIGLMVSLFTCLYFGHRAAEGQRRFLAAREPLQVARQCPGNLGGLEVVQSDAAQGELWIGERRIDPVPHLGLVLFGRSDPEAFAAAGILIGERQPFETDTFREFLLKQTADFRG